MVNTCIMIDITFLPHCLAYSYHACRQPHYI